MSENSWQSGGREDGIGPIGRILFFHIFNNLSVHNETFPSWQTLTKADLGFGSLENVELSSKMGYSTVKYQK